MHHKLVKFLSTMIFYLIPILASSEPFETIISADMITVDRDEILYAKGNVKVQYGNSLIKAKSLVFDQKLNEIKFTKLQEFSDGNAINFSADQAVISSDLSNGSISRAELLLDDAIKIQAGEVSLKNGEIFSAEGVSRVTSCKECDGKQPKWYLTASSAKRDIKNSNIVYKNVTVRVKGVPVAYVPYIRMPDPSVDRARGFLVPEAVLTSNLGTGIKLPYFIPIGLSSDLLVTPYFSSKTKTLEYRVRKKFRNGDLRVNGAFSDDDLRLGTTRYFSQLVGKYKLGYGINLNFNAGKVGDNSYLGDYAYSEESDFKSEIFLGKTVVEKRQFFDGNLSYLRKKEQGNSLDEYYSFSGSYMRDVASINLLGKLRLLANLNSSLNVNDDNSVSRPPSSAQLGIEYTNENFLGPIQFSTDIFSYFNSFVNSTNLGTTSEESSFKYGAVTSMSAPQIVRKTGKTNFLVPKISLSLNDQENDILGDYFKGNEELSWGNIYTAEKIMSLTESEKGISISAGLESRVFWETGQRLEVSFAASKIEGLTYSSNAASGLTSSEVNYLGKFSYKTKNANGFFTDTLFSSGGKFLKGDVRGRYSFEKLDFKGDYQFIGDTVDSRISKNLQTLNITSSYNFLDDLKLSAGGRYDLTFDELAKASLGVVFSNGFWTYDFNQEYLKEEREKFSLSATYDDECTRFTFSFENRYQDLGSSAPVKSLMFRVQLKPFANVVFSQGGEQITF